MSKQEFEVEVEIDVILDQFGYKKYYIYNYVQKVARQKRFLLL